jgi:hypothetical protein
MPEKQRMLELALKGLEAERATIDDEIAQIKAQLDPHAVVTSGAAPGKKTMSAAARRRISEGMKRRYAEMRRLSIAGIPTSQMRRSAVAGTKQSTATQQNGGSGLTAAGRKKLSDMMTKRWADRRKGKTK